ncbi:MAG TPA: NTP transferase domain-containing protein, partial [Thermodesulfobacteriota bacterium]|nr:NTP transferase domain-containing protein [Thermodesulfobacteriota bacterium]
MPLTRERPKCLLPVGGRPIVLWQLEALAACGLDEVVIVTGHGAAEVRAACEGRARCVHNPDYDTTNSLYSLALAEAAVAGRPLVLLNGDVLFPPLLLRRLLAAPFPDGLLVDFGARLDAEAMKVQVRDGRVLAIDKGLPEREADGENVGLVKFSASGAAALFRAARALVAEGGAGAWAPAAYARLLRERPLGALATDGLPWIEIDYPEDLERAEREILPRILALAAR